LSEYSLPNPAPSHRPFRRFVALYQPTTELQHRNEYVWHDAGKYLRSSAVQERQRGGGRNASARWAGKESLICSSMEKERLGRVGRMPTTNCSPLHFTSPAPGLHPSGTVTFRSKEYPTCLAHQSLHRVAFVTSQTQRQPLPRKAGDRRCRCYLPTRYVDCRVAAFAVSQDLCCRLEPIDTFYPLRYEAKLRNTLERPPRPPSAAVTREKLRLMENDTGISSILGSEIDRIASPLGSQIYI